MEKTMYTTQKVVDAYTFGNGEKFQLAVGSRLIVWTLEQMTEDGVDTPVAETKKASYETLCLRRTSTANMNRKFTQEQQILIAMNNNRLYEFCERWELPNAELFVVLDDEDEDFNIHVWVSKDDLEEE